MREQLKLSKNAQDRYRLELDAASDDTTIYRFGTWYGWFITNQWPRCQLFFTRQWMVFNPELNVHFRVAHDSLEIGSEIGFYMRLAAENEKGQETQAQ